MITKENYEAYFLDYIEGNLSSQETDALVRFLDEHPDLREELSAYDADVQLTPAPTPMDKSALYQTDTEADAITADNAEDFAIADVEGELSAAKSQELDTFISQHPKLQRDLALIYKTTLKPDLSVQHPDKGALKKSVRIAPMVWYRMAGVAAILLMMVYFLLPGNETGTNQQLAQQQSNTTKQPADNTETTRPNDSQTENSSVNSTDNITTENQTTSTEATTSQDFVADASSSEEKPATDKAENNTGSITGSKRNSTQPAPIASVSQADVRTVALASSTADRNVSGRVNVPQVPSLIVLEKEDQNRYLTPKEFIVSLFKKEVLKSEEEDPNLEAEDFNNLLASVSNNKVNFSKRDNNRRTLSIQTKGFSLETKLGR